MKYNIHVLVKEDGKIIRDGILINMKTKRKKWFKTKHNAQVFADKFVRRFKEHLEVELTVVEQEVVK